MAGEEGQSFQAVLIDGLVVDNLAVVVSAHVLGSYNSVLIRSAASNLGQYQPKTAETPRKTTILPGYFILRAPQP